MVASRATSYRMDPAVKMRLERRAADEGITERALLERLVVEGLNTLGVSSMWRRRTTRRGAAPYEVNQPRRHGYLACSERHRPALGLGAAPTRSRLAAGRAAR